MLRKEYPFLYFLGHNKHQLAINELARNLYITDKETKLRKKFEIKLLSLANGKYKKQQLHLMYPILQLLAFNVMLSFAS